MNKSGESKKKNKGGYRDFAKMTEDEFLEETFGSADQVVRSPKVQNFPEKLHYMLGEMVKDGQDHIISWGTHGRSFKVHDQEKIEKELLPMWFRQKKFTSFQRQLNFYGFHRIVAGPDAGGYYHEMFLRGKPFLSKYICKIASKGPREARKGKTVNSQPNLSSWPPLPATIEAKPPPHSTIRGYSGNKVSSSSLNSAKPASRPNAMIANAPWTTGPPAAASVSASLQERGGSNVTNALEAFARLGGSVSSLLESSAQRLQGLYQGGATQSPLQTSTMLRAAGGQELESPAEEQKLGSPLLGSAIQYMRPPAQSPSQITLEETMIIRQLQTRVDPPLGPSYQQQHLQQQQQRLQVAREQRGEVNLMQVSQQLLDSNAQAGLLQVSRILGIDAQALLLELTQGTQASAQENNQGRPSL